jgi:quinol monooxygenase YgiN
MLIVHARAEVSVDALTSLKTIADKMVAASNLEPGCISYAFAFDLQTPGLMRIVEVWRDQAALNAHFKTPHMAEFQVAIKDKVRILGAEKYLTEGPLPLRG